MENKTKEELIQIAKEQGVDIKKNATKQEIINELKGETPVNTKQEEITQSNKTRTLDEVLVEEKNILDEIEKKTSRNAELESSNKYLKERMEADKADGNLDTLENLTKIFNENSRQFAENQKKIAELNLKHVEITKEKIHLTKLAQEEQKAKTQKLLEELEDMPVEMCEKIFEWVSQYDEKRKEYLLAKNEYDRLCEITKSPYEEFNVSKHQLNPYEKNTIIRRLKDLSKLKARIVK